MIIALNTDILAGEGDEAHLNLRIAGRQILQEAEYLRAESIEIFNRKNQRTTLTFQTHKYFTNQAEADVWMLDRFPTLLALCGTLHLKAKTESLEAERYIASAAVASLTTGEVGVSIELFWEIHAGKILT